MTAEQGERCPVCEGLDQPGLLHNVNAPYCSASTEQGDVETMILSALGLTSEELNEGERGRLAAVIDQFAAALERAERERDRLIENVQACNERSRNLAEKADRAEKAERALAAAELEKEGARRGEDEAWEKWQKAERALAEMAELAKRAKSQAAAPDYDEEAIRDLLWAIVDAALPFLRNQSGGVPDAGAN